MTPGGILKHARAVQERYQSSSEKVKAEILDDFAAATQPRRKTTIRLLTENRVLPKVGGQEKKTVDVVRFAGDVADSPDLMLPRQFRSPPTRAAAAGSLMLALASVILLVDESVHTRSAG